MKREEVLNLWHRAVDATPPNSKEPHAELLLFAARVAAAERDRMTADFIHTCSPNCDKPACVAVRKEIAAGVAAEREACADICDQHATVEGIAQKCAAAIRARGRHDPHLQAMQPEVCRG